MNASTNSSNLCVSGIGVIAFLLALTPISGAPVNQDGGFALHLELGRQLAVSQNLNLRAQREALLAAGYMAKAEGASFRPELVISGEAGRTERQNTIEQVLSQGSEIFLEDSRSVNAGIEGIWSQTGARYRLGYSLRETSNNLRVQAFDPFREEYQNFAGLSITQPLLKDRGRNATMARVRIAEGEEEVAFQDYRRLLTQVLYQVEASYWELYLAQEIHALRVMSFENAGELLADNRERVEAGKMSELEVLQAQAGVSVRQSHVGHALQGVVEASNRLKTLLANAGFAPRRLLRATDVPPPVSVDEEFPGLVGAALTKQPAFLALQKQIEQEQTKVAYAKNQSRPRLDLKASYGFNGLDTRVSDAMERLEQGQYPSWTVGLEFRIPLGSNARGANELLAARARLRETELRLQMLEVEVINAVHSVHQKVTNLAGVMENLEVVVDFNEQLLLTEQSRLEEGLSDSRRLLEIESDLADARIGYLESRIAFQIAAIELEMVTGDLLANRGYDVERANEVTGLWVKAVK